MNLLNIGLNCTSSLPFTDALGLFPDPRSWDFLNVSSTLLTKSRIIFLSFDSGSFRLYLLVLSGYALLIFGDLVGDLYALY